MYKEIGFLEIYILASTVCIFIKKVKSAQDNKFPGCLCLLRIEQSQQA